MVICVLTDFFYLNVPVGPFKRQEIIKVKYGQLFFVSSTLFTHIFQNIIPNLVEAPLYVSMGFLEYLQLPKFIFLSLQ